MNHEPMSQTRRRGWLTLGIWALAGAGFAMAFFSGGGPGRFDTDSSRHLAGAAALAFGYSSYVGVLWITRRRKGGPLLVDERDAQVSARAGQVTLVIVLTSIFLFSMGLWVAYESTGVVPVGWMWFLAYGSVILTFLTHCAVTLAFDARAGGHG